MVNTNQRYKFLNYYNYNYYNNYYCDYNYYYYSSSSYYYYYHHYYYYDYYYYHHHYYDYYYYYSIIIIIITIIMIIITATATASPAGETSLDLERALAGHELDDVAPGVEHGGGDHGGVHLCVPGQAGHRGDDLHELHQLRRLAEEQLQPVHQFLQVTGR